MVCRAGSGLANYSGSPAPRDPGAPKPVSAAAPALATVEFGSARD